MTRDDILSHFRQTGAMLEGHFVLSSGLHSDRYLQCAKALEFSQDAMKYGKEIARLAELHSLVADTIASPAIGGLVIGFAAAAAMNLRFIWTERVNGQMQLRRGFRLRRAEKVIVVEDVITTGGSTKECIQVIEENGGEVIAAASIIDRSGGRADVGVKRFSLLTLEAPSFTPEECPLCKQGSKPEKPGSRQSAG
ncbi:MAG TPA: orotate phosphoribosyltransferase [Pyrinomonadaceae bacterium]|jgi:orotate phosphoribosyltransferase|nr:orotate phosphoribosyltransferase [Pyrinomonadaceae bacterium]